MSNRTANGTEPLTRVIISSPEAEEAVLGSLLIDPGAIEKVFEILKVTDFFRETNQVVYGTMLALRERGIPIDFLVLIDELGEDNEFANPAYITELITHTPTSINVVYYANIVRNDSIRRELLSAAGKLAALAYNPDADIRDTITEHLADIKSVQYTKPAASRPVGRAVTKEVTRICDILDGKVTPPGIMTGYTMLDRLMGGLQDTDLVIVGARPGMGKTSLALGVANHAARHGKHVLIMSLEMSEEQLADRLLAMHTGIDSQRIRSGKLQEEELPLILTAADLVTRLPLTIISPAIEEDLLGHYEARDLSVNSLRAEALALKENGNPVDLIIVDYLQLLDSPNSRRGANPNEIITEISRSLKQLAMELRVPVIVLSQLSRAVEQRADKHPLLSDLRDSGSIEQDADVVIFLYRDDYYDDASLNQNIVEVIIAKGRNIPTGTISLFFRKELTLLLNLEIQRTELDY